MRVYHILSADHAISSVALKRMKISRYGELNDPFELMAGNLSDRNLRRAVNEWKAQFHKEKGMLCFSKDWINPVLWSHYGDKHLGVALGFDIPDKYASPIEYSNTRLDIKFKDGNPEKGLDETFVHKLVHTKFEHWRYEEEVRVHVGLDEGTKEGGLYFYNFNSMLILRKVILGHNCELPINKVRSLIESNFNNVEIIKARLAFTKFEVVINQRYKKNMDSGKKRDP